MHVGFEQADNVNDEGEVKRGVNEFPQSSGPDWYNSQGVRFTPQEEGNYQHNQFRFETPV